MWIITNKGIISVVQDRHDPERLLVRSRNKAFLQSVVEDLGHEVTEDQNADYPYRLFMGRMEFMDVLLQEVEKIKYPNFKNSVVDPVLQGLYSKVWSILSVLGMGRYYGRGLTVEELERLPNDDFEEDGSLHEDWGRGRGRRKL